VICAPYGGLDAATGALGCPSVKALQDAIKVYCGAPMGAQAPNFSACHGRRYQRRGLVPQPWAYPPAKSGLAKQSA
jgi:hypothetical protein